MVGPIEATLAAELAGQEPGGQRDARQDTDIAPHRLWQEALCGALADDVEDDLDAGDAGVLDGLEGLLDLLDADTVMGDEAIAGEFVERGEELGTVVDLRGRAV